MSEQQNYRPIGETGSGFDGMNNPHRNDEQQQVGADELTAKQQEHIDKAREQIRAREAAIEKAKYDALVAELNRAPTGEQPTVPVETPKSLLGALKKNREARNG